LGIIGEQCRDFLNGTCARADRCRFLHPGGTLKRSREGDGGTQNNSKHTTEDAECPYPKKPKREEEKTDATEEEEASQDHTTTTTTTTTTMTNTQPEDTPAVPEVQQPTTNTPLTKVSELVNSLLPSKKEGDATP